MLYELGDTCERQSPLGSTHIYAAFFIAAQICAESAAGSIKGKGVAMTQMRPTGPIPPPAGVSSVTTASLLAGLLTLLAVLGLLLFAEIKDRDARLDTDNANSLVLLRANMDALWERAANVGSHAARLMDGADSTGVAEILGQGKVFWPGASFTVYDRKGDIIQLADKEQEPAPAPSLARELVYKVLAGENARDLTLVRGFVALSAAVPVQSHRARVLVVSVPLDSFALEILKPLCRADLALLLVDLKNGGVLGDAGTSANTFVHSQDAAARFWPALDKDLRGEKFDDIRRLPLSDGLTAVAVPLSTESGTTLAFFVAAPLRAVVLDWASPWRVAAFLGLGLAAALLTACLLKRRERRMAAALAGAVHAMTDETPEPRDIGQHAAWSAPLAAALDAMAGTLRECRVKVWNAERDRDADRRQAAESSVSDSGQARDFERLFADMPTGAFLAERDGHFIRVNQAFALLLGYDAPTNLMAENASFSGYFLDDDGLRTILESLVSHRKGRHLVQLRRRDGKLGHFALVFSPATIVDSSALLEGFLLDRGVTDKLVRVAFERDFAMRQRSSLALLLATVCKRTRGYLDAEIFRNRIEGDAGDTPDRLQERRAVMQSVRSLLRDIYQIAMSEVESAPSPSYPFDMGRFLSKTCRQVLPRLRNKGVSLRCDVEEELLTRFSGPVPFLRYALHRSLLMVTSTARNGWVWMSVARDPNAPQSPGVTRTLFSVSWSALSRESDELPDDFNFETHGNRVVAFDAPSDSDAPRADYNDGDLEVANEQDVIRYLVQRMHAELLEGVFTNDTRSIRIIVPLDALAVGAALESAPTLPGQEQDEGAAPGVFEAGGAPGLEGPPVGPVAEEAGLHAAPVLGDEATQSLELLVIDEGTDPLKASAKPKGGLDILLVDDSLNNRLLFSLFLRETNHRITETHDGQEGVEAFQHGRFDVIFMDMEMPLMDGYQATRIIRALEADKGSPPTPIVGMTTYALPEFKRQCMLAGCSDFLTKPFTKTALLHLLDAIKEMKQDAPQQTGR